jgi:hypothetical protein
LDSFYRFHALIELIKLTVSQIAVGSEPLAFAMHNFTLQLSKIMQNRPSKALLQDLDQTEVSFRLLVGAFAWNF